MQIAGIIGLVFMALVFGVGLAVWIGNKITESVVKGSLW